VLSVVEMSTLLDDRGITVVLSVVEMSTLLDDRGIVSVVSACSAAIKGRTGKGVYSSLWNG